MKNGFLALALCISFSGFAQVFNVTSVEKVGIPVNPNAKVAAISPQGDYILLTSSSNKGLTKFDLATQKATSLSNSEGAGYDVKISHDGQNVIYRETSFSSNHLRSTALASQNLASGKKEVLVAPTRDLQGVAVQGASAVIVNKGKLSTKAFNDSPIQAASPMLSIQNRQLMISRNGKTKTFSPNGNSCSYLWPSVSPDGSKALYYVGSVGAYVCNIDGTNVKLLGKIRAPKWYDDNTVIGMNDVDNGEFIYASTIVAVTLDGKSQSLTDGSTIAMYPEVSPATGKIAFSTPAGEAYIMNVTK